MKKLALAALAGLMAVNMIGCSKAPEEPVQTAEQTSAEKAGEKEDSQGEAAASTGVTIEFLYNLNGEAVSDAVQEVCKQFTQETGIGVEAVMPGSNFSDIMKTRMASNQLPDAWTTHGWAVARYAEYLAPLNDFSFASHISPSIQEQITDQDGNLFTLPIDMDLTGIIYNVNVLKEAGVNVDDIKTWADFETACEQIKEAGKTPIQLGGKDNYTIGNMMDFVAPTLITNQDEANQQALLDGSFDWSKWNTVVEMIDSWRQKGYFNTDAVTADYMTGIKALAAEEEVKQFMDFLAREDICSYLATKCGMPSGLDNVESDTGRLAPYYDKYSTDSSILNIPYFDRKYLPSGMWNDLCVTGATLLSGQSDALTISVDQMKSSYEEKKAQE